MTRRNQAWYYLLAFALLAGGTAAGWIFRGRLDALFAPALANLAQAAAGLAAGPRSDLRMLSFILAKNLLVAFLVLAAVPVTGHLLGLQRALATRLPWLGRVLPLSARLGQAAAAAIPVLVLVVNGAMLAWAVFFFRSEGIAWAALAGGLLPHGVPELGALCLACGHALAAPPDMRQRFAFAARAVLPLLALAAALEVFVSPAVMERLL